MNDNNDMTKAEREESNDNNDMTKAEREENNDDFNQYPHDIATYINKNGGERMVFGKLKLE